MIPNTSVVLAHWCYGLHKKHKKMAEMKGKEKSCVKVLSNVVELPAVGYGTVLNIVAHCQCVKTIFEDWS
jgi:hypothetical protein